MNISESTIRSIVAEIGGIPLDADRDADLYLDLGMASIHALHLLTELEDRFGVHIADEDFVEANSIGRLTALVDGLGGGANISHAG